MEQGNERVADDFLSQIHGQREGLDRKMITVAIHDQTGKAVRLGPNKAGESLVDPRVFPVLDGLADAAGEEVEVEVLLPAGKAAGDDLGLWIIDGGAEWAVAEVLERDDIAGFRIAEGFLNFGGIDPLVTVKNASAWGNDNTCHGLGMSGAEPVNVDYETTPR